MSKKTYGILGGVVLALAAAGTLGYLLLRQSAVIDIGVHDADVVQERGEETAAGIPEPVVHVWRSGTASLFIRCLNVPDETAAIKIFRAQLQSDTWTEWDVGPIYPACTARIIEIRLTSGEDPAAFQYSFRAVSEDGRVLWDSGSRAPLLEAPAGIAGSSGAPAPKSPGGAGTPSPQPPPPSPSSGEGGSASQPTGDQGGGGTDTEEITVFYTPEGTVSGTAPPQTEHFWVTHVNRQIEVGWQNLPPETETAVVYRSRSSSGPWEKLLEQQSATAVSPYRIRLVDNTLYEPHHYRMEARKGSSAVQTYGPILLPALEE